MLETFLLGPLFSITWDARPCPIDHNVLNVVTGTGERNNKYRTTRLSTILIICLMIPSRD